MEKILDSSGEERNDIYFLGKSLNKVQQKLHMSLPCLFPTSNTSRQKNPFVRDGSQPSEA